MNSLIRVVLIPALIWHVKDVNLENFANRPATHRIPIVPANRAISGRRKKARKRLFVFPKKSVINRRKLLLIRHTNTNDTSATNITNTINTKRNVRNMRTTSIPNIIMRTMSITTATMNDMATLNTETMRNPSELDKEVVCPQVLHQVPVLPQAPLPARLLPAPPNNFAKCKLYGKSIPTIELISQCKTVFSSWWTNFNTANMLSEIAIKFSVSTKQKNTKQTIKWNTRSDIFFRIFEK